MDAEPRLLLVTDDRRLRDDVALVAATVGAALETRSSWNAVTAQEWVVLMCGEDRLPPDQRLARATLLLGSTEMDPAQDQQLWRTAAEHPGLRPVPLPAAEPWLAQHLSEEVLDRSPGRVLAVAGALGGAGTSTVSYLLAAEQAVRGASSLLIDADPAPGAGISELLVAEGVPGGQGRAGAAGRGAESVSTGEFGWEELAALKGEIVSTQLAAALPVREGIHLLCGAPDREVRGRILEPVVRSARRVFDTVVIDAGRDPEVVLTARDQMDQLLVVAPCSARGAAAARQLRRFCAGVPLLLVAVGAGHPGWSPQDLAQSAEIPLGGDIPEQRWLRRESDLGAAYGLLGSRRGAAYVGALLEAAGASPWSRHE